MQQESGQLNRTFRQQADARGLPLTRYRDDFYDLVFEIGFPFTIGAWKCISIRRGGFLSLVNGSRMLRNSFKAAPCAFARRSLTPLRRATKTFRALHQANRPKYFQLLEAIGANDMLKPRKMPQPIRLRLVLFNFCPAVVALMETIAPRAGQQEIHPAGRPSVQQRLILAFSGGGYKRCEDHILAVSSRNREINQPAFGRRVTAQDQVNSLPLTSKVDPLRTRISAFTRLPRG